METLTNLEVLKQCQKNIFKIYSGVGKRFYSHYTDEKHLKIKIYQAINRIDMWIAVNVLNTSVYEYDLNNLLKLKKRKDLIKIMNATSNLSYETVRDNWHTELKDLFYIQREEKEMAEKLSRICVIARTEKTDSHDAGFIQYDNGEFKVTQSALFATEFHVLSDKDSAVASVSNFLNENSELNVFKVFFNPRISGRNFFKEHSFS